MPTLSELISKRKERGTAKSISEALNSRSNGSQRSKRGRNLFKKKSVSSSDLSTLEGLTKLSQAKGLGTDALAVQEEPKLSTLQRLIAGLGALSPAEAIMQDVEGTEKFLTAYPTTVVQGLASALTGNDYGEQTKKRYFAELAQYMGVENKYARFGLGLVGDIFLDPSTYFGGSVVRGAAKGVSYGAKAAGSAAARVAPAELVKATTDFAASGKNLLDTTGKLFVDGYGATKEAVEGYYKHRDKITNISRGLAISNLKRYGNDVLSDEQWEEFIGKMLLGKEKEFEFYDVTLDKQIKALAKRFPELSKTLTGGRKAIEAKAAKESPDEWAKMSAGERDSYIRATVRSETLNKLSQVGPTMQKKIGNLQSLRQRLSEPFIKGNPSIVTLKTVVSELKKEIDELTGTTITKKAKKTVPMASKAEHDFAIGNALSYEKDKLKKQVLDLQAKLKGLESGVIEPVEKKIVKTISEQSGRYNANDIVNMAMRGVDKDLSIKDMITSIDSSIFKLTNEMNEKYHLLDNVLQSKSVAKGIIDKAFKTKNFESLPDDVARALQPTSNDPKVMEAIKERLTRNAEVAMKAEIEDPYAVYAPHIRKDITEHDRILEFFQGTRRLGIGSENYKKEFRNLLKDDELLRDRTLFLRVEDQVATNAVKKQFMVDTVKQFGEPLTAFRNEKAAEKAGYVLLKEKGMFGKEVGYLLKNDFDFINGKVTQQFGALDAIAKATGFDTLNSLFKRFVTGPFASFYVRNFASGKMQNYEVIGYHALLPQTLANGARVANRISRGAYTDIEDFFKAGTKLNKGVEKFKNEFIEIPGGKKMMLDDIAKAITERFAHSTFYNNDYNALVRDADILLDSGAWSKETLKHTGKVALDWKRGGPIGALISENNPFWKTGRVIGNYIELNQKSDVVIGALYKGHTLDEALDLAEKAGFDYSKLTQFESKVMRRIIPFYTFTRKNIGLQLKTLGTNPQRINHIARTIQGAQSLFEQELSDEDKKYLPTYLREAFSVSAGKNSEGAAVFVQGFGTPIEAFTSLVKQSADGKSTFQRTFLGTLNLVTPYIKAPVEMAFGKDTFRMQDIKDVYNAKEYRDAPQFIKDYLKLKPVKKKTADGKEYTVYAADPENYHVMRSLFTHRGFTYFSNVFNEDLPGFLRIMEAMSGVRSEDVNLDYYRGLSERRQEEEIGDMLRRYGIVGEFNKLFIPKENK